MTDNPLTQEYQAAHDRAIAIDRSHEARIRATGRDRLDLLHRMSTNDLTDMRPGEARPTVFTTAIARIVDLAWVLNRQDEVWILASPDRGVAVRRWLSRYIFFQDEVRLEALDAALGQIGLFGPRSGEAAEAMAPGASALEPNHFLETDGVMVLRARPLAGDGYTVIAPAERLADLFGLAERAGSVRGSEEVYQVLRIEAGQPHAGHELTEGYIPLEANLWHAVSFSKGCYIGQEIIARMESRGRLAKTLVGLKLEAPVSPGTEVRHDGVSIGLVTSAAVSPRAGPIALAFVKPALCEPGGSVIAGDVAGTIASFPIR